MWDPCEHRACASEVMQTASQAATSSSTRGSEVELADLAITAALATLSPGSKELGKIRQSKNHICNAKQESGGTCNRGQWKRLATGTTYYGISASRLKLRYPYEVLFPWEVDFASFNGVNLHPKRTKINSPRKSHCADLSKATWFVRGNSWRIRCHLSSPSCTRSLVQK